MILLPCSCQKGTDILATSSAGDITRSEYHDWLESRSIPLDSVYKDKIAMSDYLRQITVEKLTAAKAENAGYSKDNTYITIENTLYKNLLATYFTEQQRDGTAFNEKAADISIIRIFYKNLRDKDLSIEENNKKNIIVNILAELKSGKDFNELAGKYSEDSVSQKKGHLGIIPENIMDEKIKNALDQLSENDYTKEPVQIGQSICLIKLHKRYNLNEKNIKKIVTDKENAERIIDFYNNKNMNEVLNQLINEKKLISHIDKATYSNEKEIIFTVDGENFTTADLELILKLFYSLKYGLPPTEGFSIKEKRITSGKIFKERLFASEAVRIGLDNNASFKKKWFYLKRATLAGAFKYEMLLKNSIITKEDIWNEYVNNKESKYYKIKKVNKIEVKVILPFKDVKTAISNRLKRDKLKTLKKKWDNDLTVEGNYNILNKDFLIN